MIVEDFIYDSQCDDIYPCLSLLHSSYQQLGQIFIKIEKVLKAKRFFVCIFLTNFLNTASNFSSLHKLHFHNTFPLCGHLCVHLVVYKLSRLKEDAIECLSPQGLFVIPIELTLGYLP